MLDGALVSEELESAVRAVLANLDGLQPFTTQHFNIFPYMSKWERVSKLRFMKGGVQLSTYPFVITLYVECHELASQTETTTSGSPVPIPETESMQNNPLCGSDSVRKVQTTLVAHPDEGSMSQDYQNKLSSQNVQSHQKSPCLTDGAEEMVCGSKIHADSECNAAPETPDPKTETEQKMGIITQLASSLFPFSMFFRKSSAK
ncbi:membrane-anchored junction protein isoform X2 [Triplophysa dalaica]|nr:membrane-anchored junction protein isoform X2 [Triplophysa dalaica]XP_056617762.1 membrane-anchored junction protein isoform X2 [Triplophysa dalaica]